MSDEVAAGVPESTVTGVRGGPGSGGPPPLRRWNACRAYPCPEDGIGWTGGAWWGVEVLFLLCKEHGQTVFRNMNRG